MLFRSYLAIKEALKDDAFRGDLPKGEIPASWVQDASDWPEEKRRRFIILDNASFGEMDFDVLANLFSDLPLVDLGVDLPADWMKELEEKKENIVPDKDPNILVRVSFHPGIWLGKREEIMGIVEKLKKTYGCDIRIEE